LLNIYMLKKSCVKLDFSIREEINSEFIEELRNNFNDVFSNFDRKKYKIIGLFCKIRHII